MIKPNKSNQHNSGKFDIFSTRMGMEKKMGQIGKLLAEKNFSSEKEMNDYLAKILNSDESLPQIELTPLEKAQDVMYGAWEATNRQKRIKLCQQALEYSKDCADAYVLLAE